MDGLFRGPRAAAASARVASRKKAAAHPARIARSTAWTAGDRYGAAMTARYRSSQLPASITIAVHFSTRRLRFDARGISTRNGTTQFTATLSRKGIVHAPLVRTQSQEGA